MKSLKSVNNASFNATISVPVNELEVWESVFGSSPFSFGNHWYSVDFLGGANWNTIGKVRLVAIDEITLKKTQKTIGIKDLLKALPIANEQVYMDLFNFDEYDAIRADAVLQVAVLGKVIYG
jgi:hypothetical protein